MNTMKVLCTIGLQRVFLELTPELEAAAGCSIEVEFGVAATFAQEIAKGRPFDIAFVTGSVAGALVQSGKALSETVSDIARSGLALAVRVGARKPDIGSIDKLRDTLLSARSVATSRNGLAGQYFLDILHELEVESSVRPKIVWETSGGYAASITARGDAEMAVQLVSEILPVRGVEIADTFPAAVQRYAVLSSCIAADCVDKAAAEAVVARFRDPSTESVLTNAGLERCYRVG